MVRMTGQFLLSSVLFNPENITVPSPLLGYAVVVVDGVSSYKKRKKGLRWCKQIHKITLTNTYVQALTHTDTRAHVLMCSFIFEKWLSLPV
jgi:hypothetical protein